MSKEIQLKNVTIFRKNILGMFDVIKYLVYIIREVGVYKVRFLFE